jgi:peroxiredoxin
MTKALHRFGFGLLGVAVAGLVAVSTASTASAQKTKDAVAKVGAPAPDFTLTDLEGNSHTLSEYTKAGKIVVLEWFNPDCPFVVKHHKTGSTMQDLSAKYAEQGVVWLAINSGKPGKQGTGMERNLSAVEEFGFSYPLMLDETSMVGEMYGAKTTPHMYIIDTDGVLRYAGAIDNNPSATKFGDVNYVDQALTQILAGETVTDAETRAYGCSVKY